MSSLKNVFARSLQIIGEQSTHRVVAHARTPLSNLVAPTRTDQRRRNGGGVGCQPGPLSTSLDRHASSSTSSQPALPRATTLEEKILRSRRFDRLTKVIYENHSHLYYLRLVPHPLGDGSLLELSGEFTHNHSGMADKKHLHLPFRVAKFLKESLDQHFIPLNRETQQVNNRARILHFETICMEGRRFFFYLAESINGARFFHLLHKTAMSAEDYLVLPAESMPNTSRALDQFMVGHVDTWDPVKEGDAGGDKSRVLDNSPTFVHYFDVTPMATTPNESVLEISEFKFDGRISSLQVPFSALPTFIDTLAKLEKQMAGAGASKIGDENTNPPTTTKGPKRFAKELGAARIPFGDTNRVLYLDAEELDGQRCIDLVEVLQNDKSRLKRNVRLSMVESNALLQRLPKFISAAEQTKEKAFTIHTPLALDSFYVDYLRFFVQLLGTRGGVFLDIGVGKRRSEVVSIPVPHLLDFKEHLTRLINRHGRRHMQPCEAFRGMPKPATQKTSTCHYYFDPKVDAREGNNYIKIYQEHLDSGRRSSIYVSSHTATQFIPILREVMAKASASEKEKGKSPASMPIGKILDLVDK